jgi:acyl-CoA synthetase (AMP-forming)/AMP-acid ligase II
MQLWDALTERKRGTLHAWNGTGFETADWDEVVRDAERIAVGLRRAGIGPGIPLAAVLTNSPLAVRGLLGAWLAGAPVASLPVPARGMSVGEYAEQLVTLREHVGSPMIVTDERLADMLPERVGLGAPVRGWESFPADGPFEASPPEADELAFVQYSSGSTAMPKGCMLSARAIASQLEILAEMAEITPGAETVGSWLPLSHDMGVFGCLLFAWAWDLDLALSSPERFMMSPRTWFSDCADFGATLSAGPPSALGTAVRAHSIGSLSAPLRLRVCVIGAERIEAARLAQASEAFAPYGLTPAVWMPAYGLAEATLVVAATGVAEEPSAIHVDTAALADGTIAELDGRDERSTTIVSVGRACAGARVRLAEPDRLAEILVSSPSLSMGYFGDGEKTADRFRDGEFVTGDLGFERGDHLYVVGRSDDVLCVSGRNVYAREIEAAVDALDGVRSGCSTIVHLGDESASNGHGRLVMLLELRDEAADHRALASAAARTATAKAGITLNECVFLGKGTLPKTPSGKIQRFRCRQLLAGEQLEPLARVELQGAART